MYRSGESLASPPVGQPPASSGLKFGELTGKARCFAYAPRRKQPVLTEAEKIRDWIEVNTVRAEMLIALSADAFHRSRPAPARCAKLGKLCVSISQAYEVLMKLCRP